MSEVTRVLLQIGQGNPQGAEELLPLVYQELRNLAAAKLACEKPGQTLQATALVHEAYLKLLGRDSSCSWDSRGHFFAAAAEAMRRILVDQARRKARVKHGGGLQRVALDNVEITMDAPADDLLAMHDALTKLGENHPQKAEVVKLRYFAGLTGEESAQVLGISPATADRHWTFARAWLYREICRENRA